MSLWLVVKHAYKSVNTSVLIYVKDFSSLFYRPLKKYISFDFGRLLFFQGRQCRISPPMYSRPYLIASLWFGEKSPGMQRVKMNSIHAEPMPPSFRAAAYARIVAAPCQGWQIPKGVSDTSAPWEVVLFVCYYYYMRKVTKRKRHVQLINQLKLTKWGQSIQLLFTHLLFSIQPSSRCEV